MTREDVAQYQKLLEEVQGICQAYLTATTPTGLPGHFDGITSVEADPDGSIHYSYDLYCRGHYDHDGGTVPPLFYEDREAWERERETKLRDAEEAQRRAKEEKKRQDAAAAETRDRATYERLRKKFESSEEKA